MMSQTGVNLLASHIVHLTPFVTPYNLKNGQKALPDTIYSVVKP